MKRILLMVLLAVFVATPGLTGAAPMDLNDHTACSYCGMHRAKFAHSRMLIEYEGGSSVGTCSLHCAAIDLANKIDVTPKVIMVGDYNTHELINAEEAIWVLGGNKGGVMTGRAKWAFVDQAAADKFVAAEGGTVVSFEEAIKAAYEDMYHDTRMIREKRKKKRMKMMGK
ncbi:MAG: NosL family protein [Gammaproteobacteria bacterium]|nr:NosL family protein [Gammaproteobacteria bacterium]